MRAGIQVVDADEGRVVLDTNRGVYWHLNDAAISFLEHLGRGRSMDEYVADVVRDTGTDDERVRADHLRLVTELRRAKLVEG